MIEYMCVPTGWLFMPDLAEGINKTLIAQYSRPTIPAAIAEWRTWHRNWATPELTIWLVVDKKPLWKLGMPDGA